MVCEECRRRISAVSPAQYPQDARKGLESMIWRGTTVSHAETPKVTSACLHHYTSATGERQLAYVIGRLCASESRAKCRFRGLKIC